MSQSSDSSRTVSPSPGDLAVDDPGAGPGNARNDDAVEQECHSQEQSDDDGSTSPSDKERSDDAFIATSLVTELKSLIVCTAADHLLGHSSLCPSDQPVEQHAPDTHDDIQYRDGFSVWNPFLLCSSVIENEEYRVLICPVFGGRLAVPTLQIKNPAWNNVKSPEVLWDTYELRYCIHRGTRYQSFRVWQCSKIWHLVMQLFINRTPESKNDIFGTWALWRTTVRCSCFYDFMMCNYGFFEDSRLVGERRSANAWLATFSESLDAKIRSKNTPFSASWQKALETIGY